MAGLLSQAAQANTPDLIEYHLHNLSWGGKFLWASIASHGNENDTNNA